MIKKMWKSFFYSFVFFFSLLVVLALFVNYKLKDEINNYLITVDRVNQLNDTYILCMGLAMQNPTLENKLMCEDIKNDLSKTYTILENEYPYMNFYKGLVKN
jgi:energy-coupling factor transporter transmembrane protein EcfT